MWHLFFFLAMKSISCYYIDIDSKGCRFRFLTLVPAETQESSFMITAKKPQPGETGKPIPQGTGSAIASTSTRQGLLRTFLMRSRPDGLSPVGYPHRTLCEGDYRG